MNTKGAKFISSVIWFGWAVIFFQIALLLGCAGTPKQSLEQSLPQAATSEKRNKLQDQLLAQAGGAAMNSYQDYEVGPEDLLAITFFGLDDLEREVRVNGQGEISLPLIGTVKVAGLSASEIEQVLKRRYKEGDFVKNPQVSVIVKEYRFQRVMVSGAVMHPGTFEMIGPRSLLEVLGKAGGLNEKAGSVVHVIRSLKGPGPGKSAPVKSFSPNTETIVVDLERLLLQGSMESNLPIKGGDVVYVPYAKNAYVLGAVKKPGEIPIKDKITVSQAMALAGGLDPMLASNSILILRFDDKGERTTIPVNLASITKGKSDDLLLKENDVVFVEESTIRRFLYNIKNLSPGSFGLGYAL